MAQNDTKVDAYDPDLSRVILKFLKDGEEEIETGKYRNVTLLLGFTGSGKTTLAQFITGNDEGLTAKETGNDTGEYTIVDSTNNICQATTESCTVIPKLYVNKETDTGFYDCPGYGDTRSVQHDISVSYFIKKVIDSAEAVKLVFTVAHHAVRHGVDRGNFMLLVRNALNMMKKVDKFKDGIALVVTKVENHYIVKRGEITLVPDEKTIENIAKFLESAQDSLKSKLTQKGDAKDLTFYKNAMDFIDVLLEKRDNEYTRISLFRRPDQPGKLRENNLLRSGRINLNKMIQDNIRYINVDAADFGYTVSAESLNHMHALMDQVDREVTQNIEKIGKAIQEHYLSVVNSSRNIEGTLKTITQGRQFLSRMKGNYSRPTHLLDEIRNLAEEEDFVIPDEAQSNLAHYDHFLEFIHTISSDLKIGSFEWTQGLKYAVEFLESKQNWLQFLNDLQSELSKFNVLSDIRKNSKSVDALEESISELEETGSADGLTTAFQEFVHQIFKEGDEKEFDVKGLKPSLPEWTSLKELLDFGMETLCYQMPTGEQHMLVIKGQYVMLSDVLLIRCKGTVQSAKIFATKKVFVDVDYVRPGNELVIMAPTWEVMGSPKIVLDGADGADAAGGDRWRSGWWSEGYGKHGMSGYDGEEGGLFWGIAQNCMNCQHLSISANGGKGGAGEDGRKGDDGRDFYHIHTGDEDGLFFTLVYNTQFTDRLRYGERGGNGGNGGNGGRGGAKGMAEFVLFGEGSKPMTTASPGMGGREGRGGEGGQGGFSDRVIQRTRAILFFPWKRNEIRSLPRAESGTSGRDGFRPWISASPSLKFSTPVQTLKDYTESLQVKINFSLTDATTRKFVQNLENAQFDQVIHHVGRRAADESDGFEPTPDSAGENGQWIKFISRYQPSWLLSDLHKPLRKPATSFKNWLIGQKAGTVKPFDDANFLGIYKATPTLFGDEPQQAGSQIAGGGTGISTVQSHLLFWDYFIRMNTAKKQYRRRNVRTFGDDDAQRMAYSAYDPRALNRISA